MDVSEPVWIGLNDLQTEGEFLWSNGDVVNSAQWAPGHPTRGTDKNCVAFKPDSGFQTMECSEELHYACESEGKVV